MSKKFLIGNLFGIVILVVGYYEYQDITTKASIMYNSELEKKLCPPNECPGSKCLCVIGAEDVWYFNETIGDLEEFDGGVFTP